MRGEQDWGRRVHNLLQPRRLPPLGRAYGVLQVSEWIYLLKDIDQRKWHRIQHRQERNYYHSNSLTRKQCQVNDHGQVGGDEYRFKSKNKKKQVLMNIKCQVENRTQGEALHDTGASVNILGSGLLRKLNEKRKPASNKQRYRTSKGMGEISVGIAGSTELHVQTCNMLATLYLLVVDQKLHLIIGKTSMVSLQMLL